MKTYSRYLFGLVLALGLFVATLSPARAFIGVSVGIAPPPLPVCVQPAYPGAGYIWTPGYWAWDTDANDYYYVPGAWVLSPEVGLLWTPCWWGWQDGAYCFHSGFWGPSVGFYGGIDYGYGYNGRGYDGGYWRDGRFHNRDVATANGSRVSFNGGRGGTTAVATAAERNAAAERRLGATSAQNAQARSALADPSQRFSSNHGRPAVTGTARAGSFHGNTASTATSAATRENAALTGERANASRTSASGESAFTGEPRTASSERTANERATAERTASNERATTQRAATQRAAAERTASNERMSSERRSASTESSYTGESRSSRMASTERASSTERHVSSTPSYHPAVSQSHYSVSHSSFSAPSHTSSFHSSGGSFAHASVSHSGGGGFSGGHASGGGSSGGGHASGGGGGHGGGGGGRH
jgi:hypothetical protein